MEQYNYKGAPGKDRLDDGLYQTIWQLFNERLEKQKYHRMVRKPRKISRTKRVNQLLHELSDEITLARVEYGSIDDFHNKKNAKV